jgi:ferredoxin-NADP reductase/ferredoxin
MLKLKVYNSRTHQDLEIHELFPSGMISGEALIGRLPECKIVLLDTQVSRTHGKIICAEGHYSFIDIGSRAGSTFNGVGVEANKAYPLKAGDVIQIVDFVLSVEVVAPPSAEEPTTVIDQPQAPTELLTSSSEPQQYMPVALVDSQSWQVWSKGELEVQCTQIISETSDVKTFRFAAHPPVLFNAYKPGQFVTLLDLPIDSNPVSRSYSISSTPSRPHALEITVKRVPAPKDKPGVPPGKVSNWLHDHLRVGDRITIDGPNGKFSCFNNPAQKLLLISAGSGITPMMAMSRWIYDTLADIDVVFFHSARSPEDIIYRTELELLSARLPKFQLAITVTRLEAGQAWGGYRGRLTDALLSLIAPDYKERTVYVCGPDQFMGGVHDLLEAMEFPMANYYEESFGPPRKKKSKSGQEALAAEPVVEAVAAPPRRGFGIGAFLGQMQPSAPAPAEAATPAPAVPLTPSPTAPAPSAQTLVVFAKAGKEVPTDGESTILEIAEEAGVKIRSSCRAGSCGTCKKIKTEGEVRLVDGVDPEALEAEEIAAGYVLTCSAYPIGRVVIDA